LASLLGLHIKADFFKRIVAHRMLSLVTINSLFEFWDNILGVVADLVNLFEEDGGNISVSDRIGHEFKLR
jgi:hypothetical protein